jgi:hypothetical protein
VRTRPGKRAFPLLAGLLASVALIVGLAACGGSPSSKQGSVSSTSTAGSGANASGGAPLNVTYGTGSVGPSDPSTTLPNERGRPIPPQFGAGQNILITSKGFEPQTLEANVSAPVVWTNLSGRPQRIIFVNFPVDSGTIPPGGTFTWSTNDAVALTYVSSPAGLSGKLLMNPVDP